MYILLVPASLDPVTLNACHVPSSFFSRHVETDYVFTRLLDLVYSIHLMKGSAYHAFINLIIYLGCNTCIKYICCAF